MMMMNNFFFASRFNSVQMCSEQKIFPLASVTHKLSIKFNTDWASLNIRVHSVRAHLPEEIFSIYLFEYFIYARTCNRYNCQLLFISVYTHRRIHLTRERSFYIQGGLVGCLLCVRSGKLRLKVVFVKARGDMNPTEVVSFA